MLDSANASRGLEVTEIGLQSQPSGRRRRTGDQGDGAVTCRFVELESQSGVLARCTVHEAAVVGHGQAWAAWACPVGSLGLHRSRAARGADVAIAAAPLLFR